MKQSNYPKPLSNIAVILLYIAAVIDDIKRKLKRK